MGRATMRVAFWLMSSSALVVMLLLGCGDRAQAGALNPFDFASLGAFPSRGGTYTFDTSGITLTGPGGSWTGVVYNGIAVFDFDSINVGQGQYFSGGTGPLPLALLSRSDAVIAGYLDVSGSSNPPFPSNGGPGGGSGSDSGQPGSGPGGGGAAGLSLSGAAAASVARAALAPPALSPVALPVALAVELMATLHCDSKAAAAAQVVLPAAVGEGRSSWALSAPSPSVGASLLMGVRGKRMVVEVAVVAAFSSTPTRCCLRAVCQPPGAPALPLESFPVHPLTTSSVPVVAAAVVVR
jgi:hypothetical protein